MFAPLSAIQNAVRHSCQSPTVTHKQALVTSLATGIILGLAGCIVGVLASITSLIAISALFLGSSLLVAGLLIYQHFCPLKRVAKELPSEAIPELPELEMPEPVSPPPSWTPPKPAFKKTIREMVCSWNSIGSTKLMPYFLSSKKISLSFKTPLARFSAWNMPRTKTLFISTSGPFASLRLQSNLPAAIVNLAQSISCSKGTRGGGTNYLLSSVITDSCWEASKPRSGLLLPGECSSTQWEDRDSFVPTWNPETKTYNKPTRFIQVQAPKASMYDDDTEKCYRLCFRAYLACFEDAIKHGCQIIQVPLLSGFSDFIPKDPIKQRSWLVSAKLALLHAVASMANKYHHKDLIIVLTNIPQPVYF
ncbi:hypothetical protein [Chlamydia suis]|uniref:hypothetical protein n=1 Tax=Chlamydia suis TaxID=83559 RepID=UPI0009AF968B|nr:hypothetical protein [Chlamydia suis]